MNNSLNDFYEKDYIDNQPACLINRSLRDLKPVFPIICKKLHSLRFEPQTWV